MQRDKRYVNPGTFAEVIRKYRASHKFLKLAVSSQKHWGYLLSIAELHLGAYSVDQIGPPEVQAFLDGFSDRLAQQRSAKAAIKAVEKFAIVRRLLPWPVTTGTEAPGSDGGHEPWTDDQVELAERESRPHISQIITLSVNTGQRNSDVIKMRWTDLEVFEGRMGINVIQKKTGVRIWIPLTQKLADALEQWERRPGFIALKENGMPWERHQATLQWARERDTKPALAPLKAAGLVLHGLRATAVVRLRRAGATTGQIKDMVGMSEPMVGRYCRMSVQRENALAAVHYLDTNKNISRTRDERGK